METSKNQRDWLNPFPLLSLAFSISLITSVLAIQSAELEGQVMVTFVAYYIILAIMTIMFKYRVKLIDTNTFQFLRFSFFLFGSVLVMTGILGTFSGNLKMAAVFLLVLFLPGLAIIHAGIRFKNIGE